MLKYFQFDKKCSEGKFYCFTLFSVITCYSHSHSKISYNKLSYLPSCSDTNAGVHAVLNAMLAPFSELDLTCHFEEGEIQSRGNFGVSEFLCTNTWDVNGTDTGISDR